MARKLEFIDLRKELSFVQNRYAFYWAALRSSQLNSKCSCDTGYGPLPSCTQCMATGYLFVDKLVKLQRARTTPGIDLLTEIGIVNTSTSTFILEQGAKPKNTDWILELDLNEDTGAPKQPISVIRSFKIQDSFPARGKDGRIEFWYCYTEERNFDFGKRITQKPKYISTEVETAVPYVSLYELAITNLDGVAENLDLVQDFAFRIRNLSGEDKTLSLIPNKAPPTGRLPLRLFDGTDTTITVTEK